jgi:hypothetical protein
MGSAWVVAAVMAAQKPFDATDPSPPRTTPDIAGIVRTPERIGVILHGLRPAGGRRVLRADAAAHRQGRRAGAVRVVKDDADVASVGVAAGASHRGTQRIGRIDAEGQEEGPRPVIAAGRIVRAGQLHPQEDLRHVVTAGRKLIEHLLLRHETAFLHLVQRARQVQHVGEPPPVDPVIGCVPLAALHDNLVHDILPKSLASVYRVAARFSFQSLRSRRRL